jgi:signal transduction histidine kinase
MVISARTRILGWMLMLVALAVGASIAVARSLLIAQLDERLDRELAQEVSKFRFFANEYGGPADVDALMRSYMREKVPDHNETFFSIVDGRAARRVAADAPARLDADTELVDRLTTITTPAYGWAESTAVGVGALIVAGAVGWLVAGRVLAPVRAVRATAERISETDLTRRIEVRGSDDIAQLARTFNSMLDRLEGAFATQRRFLDDAGHELRTPITVIRGHLEVMGDDPKEREAAVRLVLGELDRMKRIVDDLVLLAKAREPDFVQPGEVELAELTVELLAKARVLGNRQWRIAELSEETVIADGERLTQALAQLADNAVVHTATGDAIEVGSAVRDGRVELWVRDSGPGVDDEVRDRIFERFARGDGDGAREGAGLGLAIVASIAEAHGGRVRLDSTPNHGAKFTLDIPLRRPPQASAAVR